MSFHDQLSLQEIIDIDRKSSSRDIIRDKHGPKTSLNRKVDLYRRTQQQQRWKYNVLSLFHMMLMWWIGVLICIRLDRQMLKYFHKTFISKPLGYRWMKSILHWSFLQTTMAPVRRKGMVSFCLFSIYLCQPLENSGVDKGCDSVMGFLN